jgi:hypothetical protein
VQYKVDAGMNTYGLLMGTPAIQAKPGDASGHDGLVGPSEALNLRST